MRSMQSQATQKKINATTSGLVFVLGLWLFLSDRLVKHLAEIGINSKGGLFYFSYYVNVDGVFSLSWPWPVLIVSAIAALGAVAGLAWRAWQRDELFKLMAAGLMFIGGYSNLLDRMWAGGVVDVWRLGSLSWNLADVYLVLGLAFMLW
ncbi:MAG: signal peptidase II [Candidatus Kerfeldbacteria bacterium]|nr:signal peptidase II [Candidatus Kerfeldbacteria bacterium]